MREPKAIVRAMVRAYNARSLEGVVEVYQPDARYWDPLHRDGVVGRDAIAEVVKGLFEAFPDERMSIETLAGDDTHAVVEFRSISTLPGSGERFELEFAEVYEVEGGRIASCRVYLDPEQLPGRLKLGEMQDVSDSWLMEGRRNEEMP